jgi:cytoskeleton protein RodZ
MKDQAIDGPAEPSLSESDLLSVGARLAAAREALGMSAADVARQIKLSVPQVLALEADDMSRLPKSPVIVKGFLRNYAKLVRLDPDVLLGTLQPIPSKDQARGRSRRRDVEFDRPNRPWLGALGGVLLVAILLGGYEFYMNPDFFAFPPAPDGSEQTSARPRAALPKTPVEGQTPNASAKQPAESTSVNAPAEAQGTTPAESAASASAATAPVAPGTPPTAAAVSGQGIVRFRFARDAWVEVKDRDGNRILNQLGKSGTEKSVQGIPPLQLVVGAASGVKVEWNDQPVDLAPYTKVDVARFTLE